MKKETISAVADKSRQLRYNQSRPTTHDVDRIAPHIGADYSLIVYILTNFFAFVKRFYKIYIQQI